MPDVELNVSREECAQRIAKTRRAMERQGIELLIVTDPSNMAWLTGYDGWSFYVHQCVLLTEDDDPVAVIAVPARWPPKSTRSRNPVETTGP